MAKLIECGPAAHDSEKKALKFLVQGLPESYLLFSNPWILDRDGRELEVDAVIAGDHAIYVVEIKGWAGKIHGNDDDWYTPRPVRSPLKLNRLAAQILKGQLKLKNREAARIWIQGFVFLSNTERVDVVGPGSEKRVHTRRTILDALQDGALIEDLSGRPGQAPSASLRRDLEELLRGDETTEPRRPHRLGEYVVDGAHDSSEKFTEYDAHHSIDGHRRILRVYPLGPLPEEAAIEALKRRVSWEANVFHRLKRHPHILDVEGTLQVEEGFALPFESFEGVSLATWIEVHSKALRRRPDDLPARIELWRKMLDAVRHAHAEGVVHRLLRPEVVRLADTAEDPDLRLTGFELAKRLDSEETVTWTIVGDDRLVFAAPEVVTAFSDADPASDQFSLGALLGLLLAERPLFSSTLDLLRQGRTATRAGDLRRRLPRALDEAVARMLALRSTDRFPDLDAAEAAVVEAVSGRAPRSAPTPTDPGNLSPGTRVGTDYEIRERLGEGGLAVVYAAHHRATDELRALKVARPTPAAEDALRREHDVLKRLDHAAIVKPGDLSHVIPDRLTLPLALIDGPSLRAWLSEDREPDLAHRRRLAEDLLGALEHLEQQEVTHNDLKPDNLLVGRDGLALIDFSLAQSGEAQPATGGTARYRDPNTFHWSHATDRWAAALCLFELFVGRHAFDGRVAEPGQRPRLEADEVDPPALVAFFHRALDPDPAARFPSARALRDALVEALGARAEAPEPRPVEAATAATELHRLPLSNRALNQLRRAGVRTAGELLTLAPPQVRALHAVGAKTAAEILVLQEKLRGQGLAPATRGPSGAQPVEPPFFPELTDDLDPLAVLDLAAGLTHRLGDAGLTTVGRLAGARRSELLAIHGVGKKRLAELFEALAKRRPAAESLRVFELFDDFWQQAAAPLDATRRQLVDHVVGLTVAPREIAAAAADAGLDIGRAKRHLDQARDALDLAVLDEPAELVGRLVELAGGVVPLGEVSTRLATRWLEGDVDGAALARLVAWTGGRLEVLRAPGAEIALARSDIPSDAFAAFLAEAHELAESWPPIAAEASVHRLRQALPSYGGNPLTLAADLLPRVHRMAGGELFVDTLEPAVRVEHVVRRERLPLALDALHRHLDETFSGVFAPLSPEVLGACLDDLGAEIRDGVIVPREPRSVRPAAVEIPARTVPRSATEEARAFLQAAAKSRGFRLVVTPPERHREIGRSIAEVLDGRWISFEERWFERHGGELGKMARAERYAAQRGRLTRSAESLLDDLLTDESAVGEVRVLGDTGLLGILGALDSIRRLYDETLTGEFGFWVLVIPGRILDERQPFFNNKERVWHLSGVVLEVEEPLASPQENVAS